MNGADYIATVELYGKKGRFYQVDGVVAAVGDTCERVDPMSLPWMLERGWIAAKPTETPKAPKARK